MNKPISEKKHSGYVKLENYKVFDFEIPEIFLDFIIKKNAVYVTTTLKLVKRNKNTKNLILDGIDILIKKIYIDDSLLVEKNYKFDLLFSFSQKCVFISPEGSSSYKVGFFILGAPSLFNWYRQSHFLSVNEM